MSNVVSPIARIPIWNPFRLALVGAGRITQESHLPAALASSMIEVVAIVDPVIDAPPPNPYVLPIAPSIDRNQTVNPFAKKPHHKVIP